MRAYQELGLLTIFCLTGNDAHVVPFLPHHLISFWLGFLFRLTYYSHFSFSALAIGPEELGLGCARDGLLQTEHKWLVRLRHCEIGTCYDMRSLWGLPSRKFAALPGRCTYSFIFVSTG